MVADPAAGLGYESAVVQAVAGRLGFAAGDVAWVPTAFDEAVAPGAKPYDFNIQQVAVADERSEAVDFSVPYYDMQRALLALPGTAAAAATTMRHLLELRLGAIAGSNDADYARTITTGDAVEFETRADAIAALAATEVDAVVIDLPTAHGVITADLPGAVIAGVFPRRGDEGNGFGLVFEKGSGLVPCVDAALQSLHADGTLPAIGRTWLEWEGQIPEIGTGGLETADAGDAAEDVDYAFLIPPGTGEQIAQGLVVEIMPAEFEVVVGEVIEIVNEDDIGYVIGPFYVGAGETMRQRFQAAGEFIGECGVSATGTIALRVIEA
jgi:polar amino acid transport system substrate-binding protein